MFRYDIIMGTARVAWISDISPRKAWLAARSYVRSMARGDGVSGGLGDYQMSGRKGCFERGIYRAVPHMKANNS